MALPLRVGVDAWNLPHDDRGIGRYVRALLQVFTADFAAQIECELLVPERFLWAVRRRYQRAAGRPLAVRSRSAAIPRHYDLLWFPFNGVSWEQWRLPAVATLHDASTFVLPGYDDAARAPFVRAAARCARLITDSAHCADELATALAYPRERIAPIPLGVGAPRAAEPTALDVAGLGRYVLFVGEAEPRKGLAVLGAAIARLQQDDPTLGLVVAGRVAAAPPLPPRTRLLGWVDDATLTALYRSCAAFAYPSSYEGFGLPVLEAMRDGAPVVASRAAGIPEAGGDAALYVAPDRPDELAAALRSVVADPNTAAGLRRAGLARAAEMTWHATARATLEVFAAAVDPSRVR